MSTLKVDNLQDRAGNVLTPARAWVNFNGTGTVAIRASNNVSSVTDNGTGDYTVNFTTAMPNTDYAAVITAGLAIAITNKSARNICEISDVRTTNSIRLLHGFYASNQINEDPLSICVSIFS